MKSKILLIFMIAGILVSSCEKEIDANEPGNLVPQTVEQDPSLPFISVNGTTLHAQSFGNPSKPLVIFLHGGPGSDYRSALNASQLASDGYHVVFYDQRGTGLSKRHEKSSYSIQLYLDDLSEVIKHYKTASNQKVFLFGHSWGAIIAAAYLNSYPEKIRGAIFVEPGGLNKQLLDKYGQSSRKLNLFSEATTNVTYYDQFFTGDENNHVILDYKMGLASPFSYAKGNEEGIEGPTPFWRSGAVVLDAFTDISENEGFDFTVNLKQFSPKVLFLYGEKNKSYGLEFAKKEASFFSNAELFQIDGTGHQMIYFKWNLVYPAVVNYLKSQN